MLNDLRKELIKLSSPIRAEHSLRFFKTGPGEYGEGDKFYGLNTPQCRALAKKYGDLSLSDLDKLIHGKYHEERTIALIILKTKPLKPAYDFYLSHTKYINNWDLVDISAPNIVGEYLLDKPIDILFHLAKSKSLWERRIAILATFAFLYRGDPKPTLKIGEMLLQDEEDLIHKAVGWLLREVGKRCGQKHLTDFLDEHHTVMPRTTLRYSIEKFPENLRLKYLKGQKI